MCLACEDIVLGSGWIGVFIVVSVVKRSLRVLLQQLCVAAVVCLACEDVVLGYGCVGVFIVVSVVKCSLIILLQQL